MTHDKVVAATETSRRTSSVIEEASSKMYAECERLYGRESSAKTHIDPRDAGGTLGLYLLGPDLAGFVGQQTTRTLGQDVLLFGVAPLIGAYESAREQLTRHTGAFVAEGARNIGFGTAVGVAAELHPTIAAATLIGGTAMIANQELLTERAQKRNNEVGRIAQKAGSYSNADLQSKAQQMKQLVGEDLYHLTYATAAGALSVKPGHSIARELAKMEPSISAPNRASTTPRLAFAHAVAGDASTPASKAHELPNLELIEPLKMAGREIPKFSKDGVLPLGIYEATLERIEARFAQNPQRKQVFDKMVEVLHLLKEAGCKRVWINGSFTTRKVDPKDFDIAFDTTGVDFSKLPHSEWFEFTQLHCESLRASYGGDIKAQSKHPFKENWLSFFQQDGRIGIKKGIILLNLERMK